MIHLRLNGPARGKDSTLVNFQPSPHVLPVTVIAPLTASYTPAAQQTPPELTTNVTPPGNAVFITPDTNVQPPNTVVVQPQPNPVYDTTIDPATGLPFPKPSPSIDPATGVPIMPPATTTMSDPRKASKPPTVGYVCSIDSCIGTGITDVQFHQLQDLLNKTNQKIRDLSGGKYLGPSISVNGIIDVNTVNSLAAISQSGAVSTLSFYDVHINPQWIADNANSLITSMQIFLGTYVDPTATVMTFWQAQPAPSGGSTFNPAANPAQSYTCADGSIVSDPNSCPQVLPPGGGSTVNPNYVPGITPVLPVVVGLSPVGTAIIAGLAILAGAIVLPRFFK